MASSGRTSTRRVHGAKGRLRSARAAQCACGKISSASWPGSRKNVHTDRCRVSPSGRSPAEAGTRCRGITVNGARSVRGWNGYGLVVIIHGPSHQSPDDCEADNGARPLGPMHTLDRRSGKRDAARRVSFKDIGRSTGLAGRRWDRVPRAKDWSRRSGRATAVFEADYGRRQEVKISIDGRCSSTSTRSGQVGGAHR